MPISCRVEYAKPGNILSPVYWHSEQQLSVANIHGPSISNHLAFRIGDTDRQYLLDCYTWGSLSRAARILCQDQSWRTLINRQKILLPVHLWVLFQSLRHRYYAGDHPIPIIAGRLERLSDSRVRPRVDCEHLYEPLRIYPHWYKERAYQSEERRRKAQRILTLKNVDSVTDGSTAGLSILPT